jgi:N-acetylneuraminic acid mutarotase
MTFKMKQLFLLLLVLSVNLLLWLMQCGGSEVWGLHGTAVDGSGNTVAGVTVKLYETNEKILADASSSVTTTNKNGEYTFKDIPSGSYVVQGIDSKSGSVTEFLHRGVEYDSENGNTDLKNDTLKHTGKLLVILKNADTGIFDGKTGYIPGTPYFSHVDKDTLEIRSVARGKYICKIEQVDRYLPVVSDSFPISPDSQTIIAIDLAINPETPVPVPKNLISKGIIDTVLGKVVLKWDSVKVSDLKTYIVLRGIKEDSLQEIHATTRTIDTVDLVVDTTGKVVTNYFQVKAKDNGGNVSQGDTPIPIDAPSPQVVKTQISKTIVSPHAPKLFIGDTARIIVTLRNIGRIIESVTWALGKSDSIVKTVHFNSDTTHQCSDTMIMVWKDSSTKTWYISAYDNSGSKVSIVEQINGLGYQPDTWQIFQAPYPKSKQALTAVSDGKKIYLMGGCIGKRTTPGQPPILTGSDTITFFSPDSFDGYHYAKMSSERYYHSSIIYNGRIYSIGGGQKITKFSTIEMFDPVTNQSVTVDTLPYIRYSASVAVYKSSFIITGGIFKPHPDSSNSIITGLIDKYDVSLLAKGIEPLSTLGTMYNARKNHSTVVCGSKLIIIGGCDSTEQSILRDVESFDLETTEQVVLASMQTQRSLFAAVAISDKVYVFGGWGDYENSLKTVETYDMKNPSGWKFVSSMKNERYWMSATVLNNKIYLAGGITINSNGNTELDSTISIYNP